MDAIVYVRLSKDDLKEDDQDGRKAVKRQREDAAKVTDERGYDVVSVEEDNDIGASSGKKRPGFEAVMKRLQDGDASVVICDRLDRIARNGKDRARFLEVAKERSLLIVLTKGADLNAATATGRYIIDQLLGVAILEIELMQERMQRTFLQKAAEGVPWWSRAPFGFNRDGTHVPAEADALRVAYASLLAGDTLVSISKTLGLSVTMTRLTLLAERNAGIRTYNGEEVGPGAWEAIVPEDVYRAAVLVLKEPGRWTGGPRRLTYLLSSCEAVVCGVCGETFVSMPGKAGRSYKCKTRKHCLRQASEVEPHIKRAVLWALATREPEQGSATDKQALLTERATVAGELVALGTAHGRGEVSLQQMIAASAGFESRLAQIDETLSELERSSLLSGFEAWDWHDEDAYAEVSARFDALPLRRRQELIGRAYKRVTILPVKPNTKYRVENTVLFESHGDVIATWSAEDDAKAGEPSLQVTVVEGSLRTAPIKSK